MTHYRYSFAIAAPLLTLQSGDAVEVAMPDSDALGPDLTPLSADLFEDTCTNRGNPVYGPIAIAGAQPGDSIRIDFLAITPDRKIARTLLAPNHGFLPDDCLELAEPKPQHIYLWEVENGRARLTNTLGAKVVEIPAAPFLGCIATASPTSTSSLLAYNHGGNIDHPDLVTGTSLWLPVQAAGALLYLGDMHAAQGHGETAGGGLEISGTARVRVELCSGRSLTTPRYRTPTGIASLAVGVDFESAARQAQADLIKQLIALGWHPSDAQMLIAQTCEFRTGGLTTEYAVVSCFLANLHVG